MSIAVMLLLLALGDDFPAGGALIVHAGASDFMHPVLAHLDVPLAGAAFLSWLSRPASFHLTYCLYYC